jgi:hypothetical protein
LQVKIQICLAVGHFSRGLAIRRSEAHTSGQRRGSNYRLQAIIQICLVLGLFLFCLAIRRSESRTSGRGAPLWTNPSLASEGSFPLAPAREGRRLTLLIHCEYEPANLLAILPKGPSACPCFAFPSAEFCGRSVRAPCCSFALAAISGSSFIGTLADAGDLR